jgi:dihydrofolate synthase / folylpolyglutamate synthase
MTFQDALKYIYSFATFDIVPATADTPKNQKLERMPYLLAALGDPHHKFQSVHIAGTKGKGSTAAMTESILRAAGYRTGLYTSPHLHTFRERIRVAGNLISREDVVRGVEKLKPLIEATPNMTTFEIITLLAFDYFAANEVEIAVVEVGLGGRLDATNVLTPRVSVITSISYDHTAVLGNTLTQIASEKAGIIKPGIPVVSSPQTDEADAVIHQVAQEKNVPLVSVSPELSFQVEGNLHNVTPLTQSLNGQEFVWECADDPMTLGLKLLGPHQLANATTVLGAMAALRHYAQLSLPDEAIFAGMANVQWPGRFEILGRHPFVIIDGAHNADSVQQLIITLRAFFPRERLHFVFGSSNDKDIAGMFDQLLPHATSLTITRSHSQRAADPAHLIELASKFNVETVVASDPTSALDLARQRAQPNDIICATGSLFIIAEVRAAWFRQRGVSLESDDA